MKEIEDKRWCVASVKCTLCGNEFISVHPITLTIDKAECPKCEHIGCLEVND